MERQTPQTSLELLYNISRELTASLDLHHVLERILALSMENIDGESGSIVVLDDKKNAVDGVLAYGSQLYEQPFSKLWENIKNGLAGWVVENREAVLLEDTSQDNRWTRLYDDGESKRGAKSAISAPLLVQNGVVGVMTVTHSSPHSFSKEKLNLIQAIADHAAVAVLNAHLYEETQRKARVMSALAKSAISINDASNLKEVLDHILEQITLALQVDAASLAILDKVSGELEISAASGGGASEVLGLRVPVGKGIVGWTAQERKPVIVTQVQENPHFYAEIDRRTGYSTFAIACAPIQSDGELIGVLEALNPISGEFDPDALLLLTGIANLAGSAIQHAQWFDIVRAAQLRYQDLFEGNIDPIIISDWEGFILDANQRFRDISGLALEKLHEIQIPQILTLDEKRVGHGFEHLRSGNTVIYETTFHVQDRQVDIPVEVYVRRVNIEGADLLQWLVRDISDRKELDTLRDDLTSMIYHDLRSPLTNVVSSLDVLGSILNLEAQPSLNSVLQIAVRSIERIQRLTNSLLDMSRLEAHQPVKNQKIVSPYQLAQQAAKAILPIAKNKELHVGIQVSNAIPFVYVDEDMILRVIINLLENATKFTPPGGKIIVGATLQENMVQMWVQDTGPGIPPDAQKRIFDKFSRLRSAEKQRIKGIGLGLAFCRLAVEAHGGQIEVQSHTTEGSRFIFTLPMATEEQLAEQQMEEAEPKPEPQMISPPPVERIPPVKQSPPPFVEEKMAVSPSDTPGPFISSPNK